jgi:hypothetical protein
LMTLSPSRRRPSRYVLNPSFLSPSLAYEENYPNFSLTRNQGTVLVPLCTN